MSSTAIEMPNRHRVSHLHSRRTMTSLVSAPSPWAEIFWDQLLDGLDTGEVIPIIGPDAVVVDGDRGPRPLIEYVAARAAVMMGIELAPDSTATLNDVAYRYPANGGAIDSLYSIVNRALAKVQPASPPEALRKLARIDAFKLYITTTFDSLLEQALNLERGSDSNPADVYAFSTKRFEDLPSVVQRLPRVGIFYLLGRVSATPEYVVTEEDTLEFVHTLQTVTPGKLLLMSELQSHPLLIIGSGYSDWLSRFFIRVAKQERLLFATKKTDYVADARTGKDEPLKTFLRHYSVQTKIFDTGTVEFINELADRWDAHPRRTSKPARGGDRYRLKDPSTHPIFVSYMHEDYDCACRLVNELRARDLPVWFDKPTQEQAEGALTGGARYKTKIKAAIESAALFVPVMSKRTSTPHPRYFRVEWECAAEHEPQRNPTLPYIMPVRIDDISHEADWVPEAFHELTWLDADCEKSFAAVATAVQAAYRQFVAAYQLDR